MAELKQTSLYGDSSLKGYWRIEEASGTSVNDESTDGGHDGTATRTEILGGAVGKFGNCGTFVRASSDCITLTSHADLKPTGACSISAWFKTSTTGTTQCIFQSYSAGSNVGGINLNISTSNVLNFTSGKNSGNTANVDYKTLAGTTNVCDGAWHHVVATSNGSNLYIYLDGVQEATVGWANNPAYETTSYQRIGAGRTGGDPFIWEFNGNIDDVALLSQALTAAQVKELYEDNSFFQFL